VNLQVRILPIAGQLLLTFHFCRGSAASLCLPLETELCIAKGAAADFYFALSKYIFREVIGILNRFSQRLQAYFYENIFSSYSCRKTQSTVFFGGLSGDEKTGVY